MTVDADDINEETQSIYDSFGSGHGVLFGIPSDLRSTVRAIVKIVMIDEQNKVRKIVEKLKERFGARPKADEGEEQDRFISYLQLKEELKI